MLLADSVVGKNYPGEAICTAVQNASLCISQVSLRPTAAHCRTLELWRLEFFFVALVIQLVVAFTTPAMVAANRGTVSVVFYPAAAMAFGAFLHCLRFQEGVTNKSTATPRISEPRGTSYERVRVVDVEDVSSVDGGPGQYEY